jgi:hypothetical protein
MGIECLAVSIAGLSPCNRDAAKLKHLLKCPNDLGIITSQLGITESSNLCYLPFACAEQAGSCFGGRRRAADHLVYDYRQLAVRIDLAPG